MFPWVYEFHWSVGHILFLGIFFSVVLIMLTTVTVALLRARRDFTLSKVERIQWESAFKDLPEVARVCRHELTGETKHRTCDHEFDCRSCQVHPTFLAKHNPEDADVAYDRTVFGFDLPPHRRYHRGHTWVENQGEGIYTIGLDDFGARMIGTPDAVELPKPGTLLQANGNGWSIRKENSKLRILSPMDGQVIERGSPEKGWYLKIRGDESEEATRHLLRREEIAPWILREVERLQLALSSDGVGPALADGGELIPDVHKQFPDVDWDGVWGTMLLQG